MPWSIKQRATQFSKMLISALMMALILAVQGTGVDLHGTVDLSINDGATNDPVTDAKILLYSTENVLETRSNRAGAFEFKNVPPGRYRISAVAVGLRTYSPRNTIEIQTYSRSPSPVAIRFTQAYVGGTCNPPEISYGAAQPSQLGHLVIAVRNSVDKQSISLATVSVLDQSNPSSRVVEITNGTGNADFTNLKPGSYLVTINQKDFHGAQATIWVPRNNRAHLTVFLVPVKDMIVCQ